ncbi:MAG: inorganic phosphate transporter, partial [Bacteroidales bacterium]|nr:inorganic phosphate transporter [Bacteroidales bacterium]
MLSIQIILVSLFVLAILSLVAGVNNDAVNFLNPAIGSKATSLKVLFVLVSLGIVFGAVFSNGMMEIARKGIFNPEHFFFDEVMFIFLAVMISSIFLFDSYASLGLPTSTTVSLVFSLLGAAVSMALIKVNTDPNALGFSNYINTNKALAIITGILVSIVLAFFFGSLIQWISRMLFSFNYEKRLKYFGAIFAGAAITFILYFMVIKGMKDSAIMSPEILSFVQKNLLLVIAISFVGASLLLELLYLLFKVNMLKVVVLVGTVSLAMAFAGNDMVNFIGVPLAGLSSYEIFSASGATNIEAFSMEGLAEPVKVQTFILLAAGLIMVLSLWFSKKAQNVIKTSIDLSRQGEGQERFGSSLMARQIVRFVVNTSHSVNSWLPERLKQKMAKQFEPKVYPKDDTSERPAFDLLRGAVNLVVASILIAMGTYLKLPLSTTYVSFMVAMGTSFADRAWGRESAVYRITGVLSVVGGWFLTAIVSFILAALLLLAIYYGGIVAIIVLPLLSVFLFLRSNLLHKKKAEKEHKESLIISNSFLEESKLKVSEYIEEINILYDDSIDGLCNFKVKRLKKRLQRAEELDKSSRQFKRNIYSTLSVSNISFEHSGVYYVQMLDYLREATDDLVQIVEPAFEHVDN